MMKPRPSWLQESLTPPDNVMIDVRVWIDHDRRLQQVSWKVHDPVTDELLGVWVDHERPLTTPGEIATEYAALAEQLLEILLRPF